MDNNNTVPLGRAGTGAAYIYGKSKSVDDFVDSVKYRQRQEALAGVQKQKQAVEIAKSLKDNSIALEDNVFFNEELAKDVNQQKDNFVGYANQNTDPMTDPRTKSFRDDQNQLLQMADRSKNISEHWKEQMKAYSANPDGYYPDSIPKALKFYKDNTLRGITNGNLILPEFEKKVKDEDITKAIPVQLNDVERVVKGYNIHTKSIDKKKLDDGVLYALKNVDGAARKVEWLTGNTVDGNEQLLNTPKDIKGQLMATDWKVEAAKQGITFKDPQEADDYLNQKSQKLYVGKQKYLNYKNELAKLAIPKGTTIVDSKTPWFPPGYGNKGRGSDSGFTETVDRVSTNSASQDEIDAGTKNNNYSLFDSTQIQTPPTNFTVKKVFSLRDGYKNSSATTKGNITDIGYVPVANKKITVTNRLTKKTKTLNVGDYIQDGYYATNPQDTDMQATVKVYTGSKENADEDNLFIPLKDFKSFNKGQAVFGKVDLNKYKRDIIKRRDWERENGIAQQKNEPKTQAKENKSVVKTVTFNLNGRLGQVPADKVEAFLKKNPTAKRQ